MLFHLSISVLLLQAPLRYLLGGRRPERMPRASAWCSSYCFKSDRCPTSTIICEVATCARARNCLVVGAKPLRSAASRVSYAHVLKHVPLEDVPLFCAKAARGAPAQIYKSFMTTVDYLIFSNLYFDSIMTPHHH